MGGTKKYLLLFILFFISFDVFSYPFNQKLTEEEKQKISDGQLLIKNIGYSRNMCLNTKINNLSDQLILEIKELNPKYLAEVIQIKPYKDNEDLPERLLNLLYNVSDYAGIPYYSERVGEWFDLYSDAKIVQIETKENITEFKAELEMSPFGTVHEDMKTITDKNCILYTAVNTNKLRYFDSFDCVWPHKMKMCILLFQDGENWILYGIGGVNAPRVPLFSERIQTSFINRINTFCSYIFEKL